MQSMRSVVLALLCAALSGYSAAPAWAQTSSSWLARIRVLPDEHERSHRTVKAAFRDVVREANQSTVHVLADGMQVALGTVVHADGYVVTKASELQDEVQCLLPNGSRVDARVVGMHSEYDLALLKISANRLQVAPWADALPPAPGSWLATASTSEYPTAIGIVSAPARPLPKPKAILGVGLHQTGTRPQINRILPDSAAERAGLRVGDVIISLNGSPMGRPQAVSAAVRSRRPGERVRLEVQRGGETLSVLATLDDAARAGNHEQADLMDSLGGPLSQRRTGFPYVLEHDTVLRPRDCGGPLVDLNGRVVGINIARVSRVSSYALPVAQLKPVVDDLLSGKYPPPATMNVVLDAAAGGD